LSHKLEVGERPFLVSHYTTLILTHTARPIRQGGTVLLKLSKHKISTNNLVLTFSR